jgi:hypothetical protein
VSPEAASRHVSGENQSEKEGSGEERTAIRPDCQPTGHYDTQARFPLPTGLPRQETIIECMASGIGGMANTKTMIEQAYSAFNKRDRVGPSL